ncbi:rhomboid family intramembrane serine protease [Tenacibaculum sp. 47A_GOM-205m]|uniref:rhomboid family intramembrane serine protease n=1 Tax=Tenacibaculum sp. 47A_GOM-205m TaxID=1380384 RepID=UPI00048D0309|nr:rhomboid family intramembrane serine protease [Tenacibaculum sp. 47A_GOM-205m]
MNVLDNLKYRFKHAGVVEKLIYVNLAVFLLVLFSSSFGKLFHANNNLFINWFALPANFNDFLSKPWTIITYGFLHTNFIHILFNLIILFFVGNLFVDYFTQKQLLSFYLLGTVFGGLIFMVGYNFFPLFAKDIDSNVLLGASAGTSAILIGIATYIPNYSFKIPLIGYVKLWHIAIIKIILDFIQISGDNAGGHLAHIGGAILGFFYVRSASNKELGIFKSIKQLFTKKKRKLKTVYKSGNKTSSKNVNKTKNQQEIDAILDKISKSGYDTLSKSEKEFLFKQGKN